MASQPPTSGAFISVKVHEEEMNQLRAYYNNILLSQAAAYDAELQALQQENLKSMERMAVIQADYRKMVAKLQEKK